MEFKDDWNDRASMSSQTNTPFVFERVVVADRSAAMLAYNYARYQRTAAVPFGLPGGPNWWMSIRDNVVTAAGVPPSSGGGTTSNPVITYISRQDWGRRMLIPADHDRLVKELYKLRDDYGWEVNVVSMDKMSRQEQLRLAARTTARKFTFLRLSFFVDVFLSTDNDGCARQRSDLAAMDEPLTALDRHGVFLPRRLRPRL